MATQTRGEELSHRLSRRRALGILALGLLVLSAFMAAFGAFGAPPGGTMGTLLVAVLTGITGVGAVMLRQKIPTAADPRLPEEVDLPLDDPRSHRTLGQRRMLWCVGALVWAAGWVIGIGGAIGLAISPWLRMSLFFGATWGSVMLGAWLMRRWTGTTSWPEA